VTEESIAVFTGDNPGVGRRIAATLLRGLGDVSIEIPAGVTLEISLTPRTVREYVISTTWNNIDEEIFISDSLLTSELAPPGWDAERFEAQYAGEGDQRYIAGVTFAKGSMDEDEEITMNVRITNPSVSEDQKQILIQALTDAYSDTTFRQRRALIDADEQSPAAPIVITLQNDSILDDIAEPGVSAGAQDSSTRQTGRLRRAASAVGQGLRDVGRNIADMDIEIDEWPLDN
jgi:hypothetical protein